MKIIIGSIFLILTSIIPTDKEHLKDPYPIWGKVYLSQPSDLTINIETQDTIFLENVKVYAITDSVIIAQTKTGKNGKYKLEFPVKYYNDNFIYVIAESPDYKSDSLQTVLYGHTFPANGMQCNFGLGHKK